MITAVSARAARGWAATALATLALVLLAAAPAAAQRAGAPSFGECEAVVDEAALRQEVFESARIAMRTAAERVDYRRIVEASWLSARFDQEFAQIVDAKIAIMREDRAYLERLLDGNIPSRAKDMATRTADLVFNSPEFDRLSGALQSEIGQRLEPEVADAELAASGGAADCLRTFLGARYASTVQGAFAAQAEAAAPSLQLGTGGVGASAAFSLAGVVAALLAVVFRRLVRRIVAAAVRRLAGAIAARLAAWASVVLGVALLVYELIAGADGVFPVIRDELTSPETRAEIQEGLIDELRTAAPQQLEDRAGEIATAMFARWRSFKENHRAVLELADRAPRFRAFLADQPPAAFEALSVVVAAIKAGHGGDLGPGSAGLTGDDAVLAALDAGLLSDALAAPGLALALEGWTSRGVTLSQLLDWSRSAGPLFDRALAYELPLVLQPAELSRDELDALLALPDRAAARKVAALPAAARSDLLALAPEEAARLARRFESAAIADLFAALGHLDDPSRRRLYLQRIGDRPGLVSVFGDGAADSVGSSASPAAAMAVLLDDASVYSPFAFIEHTRAVSDGLVSPVVLAHRYGWGLAIGVGVPLLIALGMVRWVLGFLGLRGGRRRRRERRA